MIETRNADYWKSEILFYDNDVFKAIEQSKDRIELSEEILNGMRHFCEAVACFVFKNLNKNKKYDNRFDEIKQSLLFCKSNCNYNFISSFHDNLNSSIGHKTVHG